ncbi:ABC transporter substrate-binding protein [Spirochaetia bacterium]|nr:ABC transporter substrate-binding protein [Spirochaetia bacterium]
MNKFARRVGEIAVIAIIALGAGFISCSKQEAGTNAGAKADTVTFFMLTFNNIPDNYRQVEDAVNKHIAQTYPDAGVRLSLQLFGPAEYEEKIRMAMQSGSPIDLYTPWSIQNVIAQNQCLPIEDLLAQYGKALSAIIEEDIGKDAFKPFEQDGHIYGVPINKGMVVTPTFIYDKDILAATGFSIDTINNFRDLDPVFEKVKDLYPNVFPYSGTNVQDSFIIPLLIGEKEVDVLGDRGIYMGVVFGNSGKVVNLYETAEFHDYISIVRSWYNKGYLPKDMATSSSNANEYFGAGRLFSTMAGYGGNSIGVTISGSTGKNIGSKWIAPYYLDSSASSLGTAIASTSKSPEAAMKMIDILYTDEFVINTLLYGIEGTDYNKVDAHHWAYPAGQNPNTVAYTAAFSTGIVGSERLQLQPEGVDFEDVLLKLQQNRDCKRSPYYGFVFNAAGVTNEITALTNVFGQYVPGLVCGSLDPASAIPEFNKALKAAGIDRVVAEKQKQLDSWIGNNR